MSWQLSPPDTIEKEIHKLGMFEFHGLETEVKSWIEEEDFDVIPIFSNAGGLGAARKVFGVQLGTLLHQLNEAIAA